MRSLRLRSIAMRWHPQKHYMATSIERSSVSFRALGHVVEVVLLLLVANTAAISFTVARTSKGSPWDPACPVVSIVSRITYQVDVYTGVTKRAVA